jgi:hypothetical protein
MVIHFYIHCVDLSNNYIIEHPVFESCCPVTESFLVADFL